MQLENTSENKNDLRLQFYHLYKTDTVIDGVRDSVAVIYFLYSHNDHPGNTLNSKHMIGEKAEKMLYYNLSFSEASEMDSAFRKSWEGYRAMLATRQAPENGEQLTEKQSKYFKGQKGEMKIEQ